MLEFNEKEHKYYLIKEDGTKKELISVTQLMQKHGLAPVYAGVSSDVLNAKAERGSLIHKEIENYIKSGEIGFSSEMMEFRDYVEKNNIYVRENEYRANNDVVAGTIDLILLQNQEPIIADIKTTYQLHREAVSWQLSIYLYLYCCDFFKGHYTNWKDWKGQAFHFNKDGELNVVDIPLKPLEEIQKLMECERNGELYKQEIADLDNDVLGPVITLEQLIKDLDQKLKAAKQQQDILKESLLKEMEERGLKTFEKNGIKITYGAPATRTTLDSKGIKEKYPDIYEEYSKTSEIKASLRITIKGDKNE